MKQPKAEINKRYEDKRKEERKAAHAVWGWEALKEQYNKGDTK